MKTPTFTLVAGPNGSGKSTLTGGNLDFFSAYPLLDPDVIAKTIQADPANTNPLTAGREVLTKVAGFVDRRESFAVETTLSGKNYIETMRTAGNLGFAIHLVYIGTVDVEINLVRIRRRFIGGGHDVPEADVRRRYERSLKNLIIAAHVADFVMLFDNSTDGGYREVAMIENGTPRWFDPVPAWAGPLKTSFKNI